MEILDQLKVVTGLDATLYVAAGGLGLWLRIARAKWFHFGDKATGFWCMGLGAFGALTHVGELLASHGTAPHPYGFIAFQAVMLGAGVALVELVLRKAADSGLPILKYLPSDNQWSTNPGVDPAHPTDKEETP